MKIRVKSIPIPTWCNEAGQTIIAAFNNQRKSLYLDMYADHINTMDKLADELEQGYYDFVYPTCKEAERLKDLVEESKKYPRFLGFGVDDVEVEQGATILTRCSSDELREMCIKHHYYTRGDSEAYSTLLASVYERKYVSGDNILDIARNIKSHSDTEDSLFSICQYILDEACTTYVSEYLEF